MWLSEMRKGQKVTFLGYPPGEEFTGTVLGWECDTVYIRDKDGGKVSKPMWTIRLVEKPARTGAA